MKLKLHKKQTLAATSRATELLYGGAAGGGKSHLMRCLAIRYCAEIPGLNVYLFRRTYNDLMKNHMEGAGSFPVLLAEWINEGWAKIVDQGSTIKFWNGAKIFLCHCQYEKDMFKYQGAEIHMLLIDELTHFTDKIYRFLRNRCRLGGLAIPDAYRGKFPLILNGANPGGIGHNWVKATFIDPQPALTVWKTERKEGGMLRQYIPALLEDNPTLLENDPDYAERLEGLGNEALVNAMRHGVWDIVAGGMFDDVWSHRHQIEPFQIPVSWYVDRSFDWGSSKPFSVGWWAESDGTPVTLADGRSRTFPRGTLFRIYEYYGWNGKPDEGCKMLASEVAREILRIEHEELFAGYQPFERPTVHPGPADTAIYDEENGVCIADDMEAEGVAWLRADKRAGSRKQGWEQMRKYFKAAREFPMDGPGLFCFTCCRHFIRTIPTLPRDERDPDDVDTKAEDHVADEARYRVRHQHSSGAYGSLPR